MDKNEILEKSRKENQGRDEREQYIQLLAYAAGRRATFLATALILSLMILRKLTLGIPIGDSYIFSLPLFAIHLAHAHVEWKNGEKKALFPMILCALLLVWLCAAWFFGLSNPLDCFSRLNLL